MAVHDVQQRPSANPEDRRNLPQIPHFLLCHLEFGVVDSDAFHVPNGTTVFDDRQVFFLRLREILLNGILLPPSLGKTTVSFSGVEHSKRTGCLFSWEVNMLRERLKSDEVPNLKTLGNNKSLRICSAKIDGYPVRVVLPPKTTTGKVLAVDQIMEQLQGEPLATFVAAEHTLSGSPYLVCAEFHGETFREHCDRNGLSREQRLRLFLPIIECLARIHAFRYCDQNDPDSGLEAIKVFHGKILESVGVADGRAILLNMGAGMLFEQGSQSGDVADILRILRSDCGFEAKPGTATDILGQVRNELGISRGHLKATGQPIFRWSMALILLMMATSLFIGVQALNKKEERKRIQRNQALLILNQKLKEFDNMGTDGNTEKRARILLDAVEAANALNLLETRTLEYGRLLIRLADLQGRPFAGGIGDLSGATSNYSKAVEIFRSLNAQDDLSSGLEKLGSALILAGKTEQARATLLESLALAQKRNHSAGRRGRIELKIGDTFIQESRIEEGEKWYNQAMILFDGNDPDSRQRIISGLYRIAEVKLKLMQTDEAKKPADKAERDAFELRTQNSGNIYFRRLHDDCGNLTASCLEAQGDLFMALQKRLGVLADYSEMVKADPANASLRHDEAYTNWKIGELFEKMDMHENAFDRFSAADKFYSIFVKSNPDDEQIRSEARHVRDGINRNKP